jgi:cytochrome b561
MVLMPLSGWFTISPTRPPARGRESIARDGYRPIGMRGFEGEWRCLCLKRQQPHPCRSTSGCASTASKPRVVKFWFVLPLEKIGVLEQLGETRDGFKGQNELHEYFINWHSVGAWLTIALLILHVLGALKHQYKDKHPSMQRMGIGRMNGGGI